MSGSDLILKGANVIRRDGTVEALRDIVIRQGRISEVLDATSCGAAQGLRSDCETIDCSGLYVSPGLVNLHTHSPMTLFRGIAEDVSIEDWFNVYIWPYESNLQPSDVRVGASLAILEMIDAGVTAFFDHYFMADEIVRAAEEAGIRADIAPTVFGVGDWRKEIDEATALLEEVNGRDGLVKVRMGPHSPYVCPPEVLRACAERALRFGVGSHIHISETEKQVQESLSLHGKTPFRVVHDAGLMDTSVIFAHGTWMTREDARLITRESFIALAIKTYLKLASGVDNMYRMLDHTGYREPNNAIKVGIGTDGPASSNTLSPLEQARLFALLGKDRLGDPTDLSLKGVWQTLMNGHNALGAHTGDVAPGFEADLVVWDLKLPNTWPVINPLASILYSADSRNVRDVLVRGRFLKRAGAFTTLDDREIMSQAARVKDRLLAQGSGKAKVQY